MTPRAPWPIGGGDVLTQMRFIIWEFEGAKQGHRVIEDPDDPGGRTLSGLTLGTYSREYLRLPAGELAPIAEFDALSLDDVVDVILEVFALRTHIWRISHDALRFAVLDYAVHAGADDAVPALQRALKVQDDGRIGPVTLEALDRHPDPWLLRDRVVDERYQKAGRVVLARPRSLKYLNGWFVRFGRVLTWRAVLPVLLTLTVGCNRSPAYRPEPRRLTGEEISALARSPIHGWAPSASLAATPLTLRLTPAITIAGQAVWVTCVVPETHREGVLRFGLEGLRLSTGAIELMEHPPRLFIERVPCGTWTAVCDVSSALGRERRTAPLTARGPCNDEEGGDR